MVCLQKYHLCGNEDWAVHVPVLHVGKMGGATPSCFSLPLFNLLGYVVHCNYIFNNCILLILGSDIREFGGLKF